MRVARGFAGALLWLAASVVGLLAVVLCLTVILLPVGIPLLMVARRLFGRAVALMLPRGLTHPVDEGNKLMRKRGKDASGKAGKVADRGGKGINKVDKAGKKGDELVAGLARKGGKKARELTGRKKSRLPWKR